MSQLGVLLERRGELVEAERLFRRAADLGDPTGMSQLGVLLVGQGEMEEAVRLFRQAFDLYVSGGGMADLGVLLGRRGKREEGDAEDEDGAEPRRGGGDG
ncbi:MAG: hypothetical protein DLM59_17415 [Pseudonocardiales bacterium]|nr:MAG: hypothetical protein DLM59_17415 [Pseudonocardiales bacterium]